MSTRSDTAFDEYSRNNSVSTSLIRTDAN